MGPDLCCVGVSGSPSQAASAYCFRILLQNYCFGGQICFSGACMSGFSHCKSTESKNRGSWRQSASCNRPTHRRIGDSLRTDLHAYTGLETLRAGSNGGAVGKSIIGKISRYPSGCTRSALGEHSRMR